MKRFVAGAIALVMTGCASTPMIRSVDRTQSAATLDSADQATRASYLGEYALPRSRFTVTLSAPGEAAPAVTAAAAPSVSNTITVTTTPAAETKAAGDPKPGSDLAAWCRGHREAYNQRKRTLANASTRRVALERSYYAAFDLDDL